jgi:hypothetical protein
MLEFILSLILALTGIGRYADPALAPLADLRAAQITTNFSHEGLETHEVLAWNNVGDLAGSAQAAVSGWSQSPSHMAVLTDVSLKRIWCSSAQGLDPTGTFPATYWACVLTPDPAPSGDEVLLPAEPAPYVPPALATVSTEPPTLPNTAMPYLGDK